MNYWIMFNANGHVAAGSLCQDDPGVIRSHWEKLWECAWDEKYPHNAPHKAIEYTPK